MDDILIYSNFEKEHKQHVRLVFQKLMEHSLYVKLEKCIYSATCILFLEYTTLNNGIEMDPDCIQAIFERLSPTSVHNIQVFLGFANFYRCFIDGYSYIIKPITEKITIPSSSLIKCRPLLMNISLNLPPHQSCVISTLTFRSRFTQAPLALPYHAYFLNRMMRRHALSYFGLTRYSR